VPPLSATMDELTAMIYAMAKKVASPARSSVKKYEPFLSLLYVRVSADKVGRARRSSTYVTGAIKLEPPSNRARGDPGVR
jgi:hypothetical protein